MLREPSREKMIKLFFYLLQLFSKISSIRMRKQDTKKRNEAFKMNPKLLNQLFYNVNNLNFASIFFDMCQI